MLPASTIENAAKTFVLFGVRLLVALVVLGVGLGLAEVLGFSRFHHKCWGHFLAADGPFWIRVNGESTDGWQWNRSEPRYSLLNLEINTFTNNSNQSQNTSLALHLPSFDYETSTGSTGVMSLSALEGLLLGPGGGPASTPQALESAEVVYEFLEVMRRGKLPSIRDQVSQFNNSIVGSVRQRRVSSGLPVVELMWFVVWLFGVVRFIGNRVRLHGAATN